MEPSEIFMVFCGLGIVGLLFMAIPFHIFCIILIFSRISAGCVLGEWDKLQVI